MKINSITLHHFRNYDDFTATFSPEMNVIQGENAQGKTNLMEAISFLSSAKSYRSRFDGELISFDKEDASILADLESRQRDFLLSIEMRRGTRKKITLNHVKKKNSTELSGLFHTVLFCPEDLSLVKDGAGVRRKFLDQAICQLRPKYAETLQRYQKLLDHKTRILRDFAEKPSLFAVLEDFNDALAQAGALIIHYRAHFIKRLLNSADAIQQDFSGGRETLSLRYQTVSTIEDPFAPTKLLYPALLEHQKTHSMAEISSRSCLSGPHKDDLIAEINGISARSFASQGQCRTVSLSLKLAEREIHKEETEEWPVLLLDDVLSELDSKRQEFVLERIRGGQVFLTGCEFPNLKRVEHTKLHIEKGALLLK